MIEFNLRTLWFCLPFVLFQSSISICIIKSTAQNRKYNSSSFFSYSQPGALGGGGGGAVSAGSVEDCQHFVPEAFPLSYFASKPEKNFQPLR